MTTPSTTKKLATTTLLVAGLAALTTLVAPAAHAANGVEGSISSPAAGTVTLGWRVYLPAGSTATCDMVVENSVGTTGTYREFDYSAIGGSANHQGRWVSDSFQTSAPAGSTAYGDVYCTFLKTDGQATTGQWQGSTAVKIVVRGGAPTIPPGGGVG
ncbi:hypothetical protein [Nocardia brasiliensis]|uniref:Uncharacterized protein n=1 Tax=Nocardia brasiliensis (strain ATCC 700358 / HUJEG-1) TaxID=1133849 RepID=K0FB36_NOCB7|nr:hypothetical protein [Nocardia brasiliensis]AFU04666.1 hypothetical protein O3I_033585 [Nocardia brasiliensis ATCC 700358]